MSILQTVSPETGDQNSDLLSNLSILPLDVVDVYLYAIFRELLRGVKECCSKPRLPTSAATAVWRLTYKSNLRRQTSSSFLRSNSLPDSPVTYTGCVCAASHLVYCSLSFSFLKTHWRAVRMLRSWESSRMYFPLSRTTSNEHGSSTECASKMSVIFSAGFKPFFRGDLSSHELGKYEFYSA